MAGKNEMTFELRVGPLSEAELAVRGVFGSEELSQPFLFGVDFVPVSGELIDLEPLLAAETCLSILRPTGEERWVHGICARAEQTGIFSGRPFYRVTIAPKLALLSEKKNCRIFQEMTAPVIVKAVLEEHGISFRDKLQGTYPKRDMCVQYRESDCSFVARLLEEEGIGYWFEHTSDGHVMMLGDEPKAFAPLSGGESLPYRDAGADPGVWPEHLYGLRVNRQLEPERATLRDYDFERPTLDVTGATAGRGDEVYDYPAGQVAQSEAKRLSGVRLEELRFGAETWSGEGTCARLHPGSIFEVEGHPTAEFGRRLVTVRVDHEARQQRYVGEVGQVAGAGFNPALSYKNRFIAIDEKRQYRPGRRTDRPVIAGHQTATVVGVPSEEIDPDKYGRVKIQFHWDRKGKKNDRSSAWVRAAQSWAGAGMGAVFVPRLGQEVVVRFLEGNPDRPIVTGAIYNGENVPPIALPQDKTQSTQRTSSSPHTGGFNELRFEDAKDLEQIAIHGQRDETIEIRNDKGQEVHGNEALRVDRNRSRHVRQNQDLLVAQGDRSEVKGTQVLTVKEDRRTDVQANQTETMVGDDQVSVAGVRMVEVTMGSRESIGGAAKLVVGAGYEVNVAAGQSEVVGANKRVKVLGSRIEEVRPAEEPNEEEPGVGASRRLAQAEGAGTESAPMIRTENVGGDSRARVVESFDTRVKGQLTVDVGEGLTKKAGSVTITAEEFAALVANNCKIVTNRFRVVVDGKEVIAMEKSGLIQLSGRNIAIGGSAVKLQGVPLLKVGPQAAKAAQVETRRLEEIQMARALAMFALVDQDGNPVVNERFRIVFADGSRRKGATNGDGKARVPAPKKGTYKLTFLGDSRASSKGPETPSWRGQPKASTPGATLVEKGKAYSLATDREHLFELPEKRSVMTVSFFSKPDGKGRYPEYSLESHDGSYKVEKTLADLVQERDLYRLRFEKMRGGKRYTLTRRDGVGHSKVLFRDVPYEQVVDQDRPWTEKNIETAKFATHSRVDRQRDR